MVNEEEFFTEVCAGIKARPTPWCLTNFYMWHHLEGMPLGDTWNPLATTIPGRRSKIDIGYGPGKWNNANPPYGVGIYIDAQAGIEATVATLLNGFYDGIVRSFRNQTVDPDDAHEFTEYIGNYGYSQVLVNFMLTNPADKEDDLTPSEVNQLIDEAIAAKLRTSQLIDSLQIPELVAQILGVHNDTYTDPEVLRTITAIRTKLFTPATTTPAPRATATVASATKGGN